MKNLIATLTFLFTALNLNSATHTVTNAYDNGATGSLRRIILDANSGDTIIFASNISNVFLAGSDINIYKDLTIIGGTGDEKTTIYAGSRRIFYVDGNYHFTVSNLILTDADCNNSYGGGAVYVKYGTFTATNCTFTNNTSYNGHNNSGSDGGAVYIDFGIFIAQNCVFSDNTTTTGNGGAVATAFGYGDFIAINCVFLNNTAKFHGGAVCADIFIATNCTFFNNTGADGAIACSNTYLYHCTIDKNKGTYSAMYGGYIYNCIFTGNTVADTLNQIIHIYSAGNNLIEGENGVTRDLVFGNNTLTDSGYIMPLAFVKTATRLTANDIEVPAGFSADSIISWLYKDQREKIRPDTGFVTFGAVEYDESSIKSLIRLSLTVNIFPNPTSDYFNVNFELEKASNIRIALMDLTGKEVFEIHNDFTNEGVFTKTVNTENLVKGIYYLQVFIDEKYTVEKIAVN